MKKFEYSTLTSNGPLNNEQLNLLGADGWELVHIHEGHTFYVGGSSSKCSHIFKRELINGV